MGEPAHAADGPEDWPDLTRDERAAMRDRAAAAAEAMENEAAAIMRETGDSLTGNARLALAHAVDQARELRAMAEALETG